MSVAQYVEELKERWCEHYEHARKPGACIFCGCSRLWWNGKRIRSASVLAGEVVVYVAEVVCRRVKCSDRQCRRSWTLRPEGLTPQRHYQLDVVAEGTGQYLFAAEGTFSEVARRLDCSRFTVRRWIGWVAQIATVKALLWHVVDYCDEPVVPRVLAVSGLGRKACSAQGRVMLKAAAGVFCVLEALAAAAGLRPPGLSSVVEAVVADRYRVTTYAAPSIPEFARRHRLRLGLRL